MENITLPKQVADLEIRLISQALADCKGNRSKASKALGITRFSLIRKIEKHNIKA